MILLTLTLLATIIAGIIILYFLYKNKKEDTERQINYHAFCIMGICFLPLGFIMWFVLKNPGFIGFTGLGAAYLAIGLANRDKWPKS